jgi:RNA polymerase sigma factor (sigma-70 family)
MASTGFGAAFRQLRGLFGDGSVVGLGDAQLLARYADFKDEAAFEALVTRHGPMVLTICRAVLRNEHDVEDAFQATFLVLARKAASIRGGDALAGWLHRVAHRASVQASVEARRRRLKEAEASARLITPRVEPDPELAAILHEEIDHLPERQRLPVVLCDLEGLTADQAARHLRWTEPSVRHRLADGRKRLRARLNRRGLAPSATVGALPPASAAVPASLARMALSAATGGPASAGAATLAHTLLRGMLMTQIKIASAAALAALALASAGWIAAGAGRPEDPKPAMKPKAEAKAAAVAKEEPAVRKPVEMVEVKGRVVTPDGKPIAGAAVRGIYIERETKRFPGATSGVDGRFTISFPKPEKEPLGFMAQYPWLIASAPGYGIGWAERVLRVDRPAEQEVALVEEGPPIEGRIIDLEGRPVAGAGIKADRIWFDEKDKLPTWIAKARNGAAGNLGQDLRRLPLDELFTIEVKAGPDGRFKLDGIVGRDRIADLLITGPGVATTQVSVLSRDEPEIRSTDKGMMTRVPFIVQAPRFQLALSPSKRVEGVVRDKVTGRPIAGIEITAAVHAENGEIPAPGVEAKTDAEGRYRLDGLPKATAYRLFAKPGKGQPYTNATFKAPADSPALEPVAFDFALRRGVVVRGRVTDKATGRPISGMAIYYTFPDNPSVGEFPGFSGSPPQYANFDEDGRYELVALPGHGLIVVEAEESRYLPAAGYEGIKGYDAKYRVFTTTYVVLPASGHNILAGIDLDPKAGPTTLDLQADPGKSVAIEVVGPDGRPLGGTHQVKGMSETSLTTPLAQESARFEVHAIDPARPRRVIVTRGSGKWGKLIGTAFLKGNEAGPITIKLQPWGSVAGRIVDDEGRPRKGMFIGSPGGNENPHPETHDILPWSDWNNGIRVGDDGRFFVEGLVPGLKYSANARTGFEAYGDLFIDLTVAPGEARDLGDIKVQPPKKTEE